MDLMEIISIGVDIVSIDRIKNDIDEKFLKRVYSNDETVYCNSKENPSNHFAGRLAGKEAVCKALKITWVTGINWKDIEIINNNDIPEVILHGEAKKVAEEKKIKNILISISHEKDYAIAFVIAAGKVNYGK